MLHVSRSMPWLLPVGLSGFSQIFHRSLLACSSFWEDVVWSSTACSALCWWLSGEVRCLKVNNVHEKSPISFFKKHCYGMSFGVWVRFCVVVWVLFSVFSIFLFTNYIIWWLHPSKIPIILPAMLKSWVHVAVLVKFNSIH